MSLPLQLEIPDQGMDKFKLTGQNLGRVLTPEVSVNMPCIYICYQSNLSNLKLKTRPKQLYDFIPLVISLPYQGDNAKQ
jgi:hypothetical protein